MHCQSDSVQSCYRSRLAELLLKAGEFCWLIGLPASNIIQGRAEIHDTYISRVSPENVCRGSVEACNQAQAKALVHRTRQTGS